MERQFGEYRQVRNVDNYVTNARSIIAEVSIVIVVTSMVVPKYKRVAVKFTIGSSVFWMNIDVAMFGVTVM